MRIAKNIILTGAEHSTLTTWSGGRSRPRRLVQWTKIVLLAAECMLNKDIASQLKCTRRNGARWRDRFAADRLERMKKDAPQDDRKASVREQKEAEIIRKTTQETPSNATHWSTHTMIKAVVRKDTVKRVWRDYCLKPHLVKTFAVHGSTSSSAGSAT